MFECFTLEDVVRELPGSPVSTCQIASQIGTYQVTIDFSNRFQRQMPHVLNVPGFDGIRIHSGNSAADTEGYILLGMKHSFNTSCSQEMHSPHSFPNSRLQSKSGEPVTLTVKPSRPFTEAESV